MESPTFIGERASTPGTQTLVVCWLQWSRRLSSARGHRPRRARRQASRFNGVADFHRREEPCLPGPYFQAFPAGFASGACRPHDTRLAAPPTAAKTGVLPVLRDRERWRGFLHHPAARDGGGPEVARLSRIYSINASRNRVPPGYSAGTKTPSPLWAPYPMATGPSIA